MKKKIHPSTNIVNHLRLKKSYFGIAYLIGISIGLIILCFLIVFRAK